MTSTIETATPFLTETQAAMRIGLAPRTLRNWRAGAERRGPAWLKLGGAIRYHQEHLDAWALAQVHGEAA